MTMTNKQYKAAREMAEGAEEIYTFEHYNGFSFYTNKYMTSEDLKEMRKDYKAIKAENNAFALNGFGSRALVIKAGDIVTLQSYYTEVCRYNLKTDTFEKLWSGFSVTTLKHINIFRAFLGMSTLSKREWIEMECK